MNSCYFGTKGVHFYDLKSRPEVPYQTVLAGQDHKWESDALSASDIKMLQVVYVLNAMKPKMCIM